MVKKLLQGTVYRWVGCNEGSLWHNSRLPGDDAGFLAQGGVHISMVKYLKDLWDTFVEAQVRFNRVTVDVRKSRSKSQITAAHSNLFLMNKTSQKPLSDKQREVFSFVCRKSIVFCKMS